MRFRLDEIIDSKLVFTAETVEKGLEGGQFLFGPCWIMIF